MTRSRSIIYLAGATALVLAALVLAACGGGSDASGSSGPPRTANERAATVGVATRRHWRR